MDQLVLQSSYRAVQSAALSSLDQRGFSIGCPTESNWQVMSELRQASPMSLKAFWSQHFLVPPDVYLYYQSFLDSRDYYACLENFY